MNKQRRNRLSAIRKKLEDIKNEIAQVISEEETAYDNLPESLQETDMGMQMQDALECMDSAVIAVEEAMEMLDNIE